jgi:hypothetical protein
MKNRARLVAGLIAIFASAPSAIYGSAIAAPSATGCADLTRLRIATNEIRLPNGGVTIASAQIATIPADPRTPGITVEFCKVLGAVAPIDPNAPPVKFEVNLPLNWNGKAVQYGGGGFNGTLITGLDPLLNAKPDTPVPIARGYATWGTDSGHDARMLPETAAFALNDEALTNYAYAAYRKTHDVGRRVANAFYDRPPTKIYYIGSSEGGREGLTMAQRFPVDFDGIVSAVPAINMAAGVAALNHNAIAQQNGGWLNPAKVAALHRAVNAACDELDGLADGVISAYEKCLKLFDPKRMRCPNGADARDDCLSDGQIATVEALHRPYEIPFALANGVTSYPGWDYGSEEQPGGLTAAITGSQPFHYPLPALAVPPPRDVPAQWYFGTSGVRYFVARDPDFDPRRFSPSDFRARLSELSVLLDSTNPDLSPFRARGGKLILKGNGADYLLSPSQPAVYYQSVVKKMGRETVDSFVRFYVTPGANHGGTGVTSSGDAIPSGIDLLGILDDWAESGRVPDDLVQVAQEPQPPFRIIASRPMCRYPLYPRYNGQGDPSSASSFTCTMP